MPRVPVGLPSAFCRGLRSCSIYMRIISQLSERHQLEGCYLREESWFLCLKKRADSICGHCHHVAPLQPESFTVTHRERRTVFLHFTVSKGQRWKIKYQQLRKCFWYTFGSWDKGPLGTDMQRSPQPLRHRRKTHRLFGSFASLCVCFTHFIVVILRLCGCLAHVWGLSVCLWS